MSARRFDEVGPVVLHVSQPVDAGVARVVQTLAEDQVSRGWRVSVASPEGPLADDVRRSGASWCAWPAGRNPGPATLGEARRLRRIVLATLPDVVHLHSSKAGLAGRLAVRGGRPTMFQPHAWSFHAASGAMKALSVGWERNATRWTTVTVCVSESERLQGVEAGIRGSWRVIANGVDTDRFQPVGPAGQKAAREQLGLGGEPLVVCVGRLAVQKGQDILLHAWPSVRASCPQAHLVLVGDGPLRERLMPLPAGVSITGQREDVEVWLAACDVVAVPSRWEGMSLALLEAMASGRPVVAADVAGVREALGANASAVVPIGSPRPLAAAILARLGDPARAAAEGVDNRAAVESRFSLGAMCDQIAALTLELAASGVTRQ